MPLTSSLALFATVNEVQTRLGSHVTGSHNSQFVPVWNMLRSKTWANSALDRGCWTGTWYRQMIVKGCFVAGKLAEVGMCWPGQTKTDVEVFEICTRNSLGSTSVSNPNSKEYGKCTMFTGDRHTQNLYNLTSHFGNYVHCWILFKSRYARNKNEVEVVSTLTD